MGDWLVRLTEESRKLSSHFRSRLNHHLGELPVKPNDYSQTWVRLKLTRADHKRLIDCVDGFSDQPEGLRRLATYDSRDDVKRAVDIFRSRSAQSVAKQAYEIAGQMMSVMKDFDESEVFADAAGVDTQGSGDEDIEEDGGVSYLTTLRQRSLDAFYFFCSPQ